LFRILAPSSDSGAAVQEEPSSILRAIAIGINRGLRHGPHIVRSCSKIRDWTTLVGKTLNCDVKSHRCCEARTRANGQSRWKTWQIAGHICEDQADTFIDGKSPRNHLCLDKSLNFAIRVIGNDWPWLNFCSRDRLGATAKNDITYTVSRTFIL
jgi:hypothetical protein